MAYLCIYVRGPRKTTPEYGVWCSRVTGWGWDDDILKLRDRLVNSQVKV